MSTFEEKLVEAIGESGYRKMMRRSVQTVVLLESNRMIKEKLPNFRPFQRKLAYMDQVQALLDELACIPAADKESVLWRTATSKEPMDSEIAWKRMKYIEKDMAKLVETATPFCSGEKTHNEIVDELVQHLVGDSSKPVHPDWAHANNHLIMAYRMYYKGTEIDPDFPAPDPAKEIVVPKDRPKSNAAAASDAGSIVGDFECDGEAEAIMPESSDMRREIIKEVQEHLYVLKEFEGSISKHRLDKRKRELFEALPSAPPSRAERARQRLQVGLV